MGAFLMVRALDGFVAGDLSAVPQKTEGVTYADKLTAEDERLDWSRPAVELDRQVRAMTPWPGCWFVHGDERVKVKAAELADGSGPPGTVLDDRLTVACGDGALRLTQVQRAGKKVTDTVDFLRGYALPAGTVLG
jgi:methionyl-tRNA formyltransferase